MADWTPELADDELDTLMDALEAWEKKVLAGDIMTEMLEAAFTQKVGPVPPSIAEERSRQQSAKSTANRMRKERSVLLRAKLLLIRDRRRAEHMTQDALRPS